MPKKERKKKDKKPKKKVVKFKNVQQNVAVPESQGYFANYHTPPTIRQMNHSEPRIIPAYNFNDSFGLESQYPEVASDQFIIQIPKMPLEPIRIRNLARSEYNSARDVIMPSQAPQQKEQLPEPVEEPAPVKKTRGPYKKKKIIVVAPE